MTYESERTADVVRKKRPKKPPADRNLGGRPVTIDADATIIARLPKQTLDQLDATAKKEGRTRSEAVREAFHNWVRPDEAARRRAEKLETIRTILDRLGHVGPARDAAIQKLVTDKVIDAADVAELAKPKKK